MNTDGSALFVFQELSMIRVLISPHFFSHFWLDEYFYLCRTGGETLNDPCSIKYVSTAPPLAPFPELHQFQTLNFNNAKAQFLKVIFTCFCCRFSKSKTFSKCTKFLSTIVQKCKYLFSISSLQT